ncbi:MAG: hypothetical protein JWO03_3037 [Bacteroidetes bacterium]|nr:hypothetical protein [Bacteroidota bacterium]
MKTICTLFLLFCGTMIADAQTQTIGLRSGPHSGFKAYRGAGYHASPSWTLPSYNDASWVNVVNGSVPDTSIGGSCNGANWYPFGQSDTAIWTDVTTHFPDTGCFRRNLRICGTVVAGTLNIIGDDYADTYINGHFLGAQPNAVTGQRYILNATQLAWFQPCNNVIAVQVTNSNRYCAFFSMYGSLTIDTTGCRYTQGGLSNNSATICPGQSYTFAGHTYTQAGTYRDTIPTPFCDSIAILNLTINPSIRDSVTQLICPGQSVTVGPHTYSTAGIFRDTFTTGTGCDSIHILNLSVGTVKVGSTSRTICTGQIITVGLHSYNTTGTYRDTFATAGCDSVFILHLLVTNEIIDSVLQTICPGQTVIVGTHSYATTGIYRDTFVTGACDSIYILNLSIGNIRSDSVSQSICPGHSIIVGTHTYTSPGVYRDTFATSSCDSIYILNLSIGSIRSDSVSRSICPGQSITVGTHSYTSPGIYRDTFATTGCDSIYILNLSVGTTPRDSVSQLICPGQSITVGTHTYSSTGIYRDTFATTGCDSIYTLNLSVGTMARDSVSRRVCPGQIVIVGSHSYGTAGIYRDTFTTTGCDSIHILNLSIGVPRDTANVGFCEGQGVTIDGYTYTQPGFYSDTIPASPCDSIYTLHVNIWPLPSIQIYASDTIITQGDTIQLGANGDPNYHYAWSSDAALSNTHGQNLQAIVQQSAWAVVQASDSNNCVISDSVYIRIDDCNGVIFVPNAFTPNGDGKNDTYQIVGRCITLHEMKIFNRWGEKVWETDDINAAWDGTYRGMMQPTEVYVYILTYSTGSKSSGAAKHLQGSIALIR